MYKLNIEELAGGSVSLRINDAWQALLQNMQDPNMPYKPKRKLVITLTCEQNEKRQRMSTVIDVDTKLVPKGGIMAKYDVGTDLNTGEAYANEYGTVDARQIPLTNVLDIDEETGEIKSSNAEISTIVSMYKKE